MDFSGGKMFGTRLYVFGFGEYERGSIKNVGTVEAFLWVRHTKIAVNAYGCQSLWVFFFFLKN